MSATSTMSNPHPGLQVTAPDDSMDISSPFGRIDDDIEIDLDLNEDFDIMIEDIASETGADPSTNFPDQDEDDTMIVEDVDAGQDQGGAMEEDQVTFTDEHLTDASFEPERELEPTDALASEQPPEPVEAQAPDPTVVAVDYSDRVNFTEENTGPEITNDGVNNAEEIPLNEPPTITLGVSAQETPAQIPEEHHVAQDAVPHEIHTPQDDTAEPLASATENVIENNGADPEVVAVDITGPTADSDEPQVTQQALEDASHRTPQSSTPATATNQHISTANAELTSTHLQSTSDHLHETSGPAQDTSAVPESGSPVFEGNADEETYNTGEEYAQGHQEEPAEQAGTQGPSMNFPIRVNYDQNELSLFPPDADDELQTYLLSDKNLMYASINDLLNACRQQLDEDLNDDDEFEIAVDALGLFISEGSNDATTTSFEQIVDVYLRLSANDGNDNPYPLYIRLTMKPKFSKRMAKLCRAAQDHQGMSNLDYLPSNQEASFPSGPTSGVANSHRDDGGTHDGGEEHPFDGTGARQVGGTGDNHYYNEEEHGYGEEEEGQYGNEQDEAYGDAEAGEFENHHEQVYDGAGDGQFEDGEAHSYEDAGDGQHEEEDENAFNADVQHGEELAGREGSDTQNNFDLHSVQPSASHLDTSTPTNNIDDLHAVEDEQNYAVLQQDGVAVGDQEAHGLSSQASAEQTQVKTPVNGDDDGRDDITWEEADQQGKDRTPSSTTTLQGDQPSSAPRAITHPDNSQVDGQVTTGSQDENDESFEAHGEGTGELDNTFYTAATDLDEADFNFEEELAKMPEIDEDQEAIGAAGAGAPPTQQENRFNDDDLIDYSDEEPDSAVTNDNNQRQSSSLQGKRSYEEFDDDDLDVHIDLGDSEAKRTKVE